MRSSDQVYRVARHLVGVPRGGRGPHAGDLRARVPQLALVPARHEPARVAAPDPHEPQHRPRPASSSARPTRSRSRKGTTSSTTSSRQPATGNADEERVVERLSQNDVVDALSEVPHDFRDVVVLVDIGDFTYADAAQILDIPIGTVMSRLHRGRRILKQAMAESAVEARRHDGVRSVRALRGGDAAVHGPRAHGRRTCGG